MGKYKWNEDEINFLTKEYPLTDRYHCSDVLGIPVEQIVYKIRVLNLKKPEPIVGKILEKMHKDALDNKYEWFCAQESMKYLKDKIEDFI
jgi:hypothetical protein